MAILGKDNVIEMVRTMKSPYWKISETRNQKENGNVIFKSDFDNQNLGLEDSLSELRKALDRLSPGTYYMTAAAKPGISKGIVDCTIEIERSGSTLAGIGSAQGMQKPMYIDGIGEVTAENFESAIEAKFKKMQDELDRKKKEEQLQEENKRLKEELKEKENGITGGLYSIGAMFWPQIKKSGFAKDMITTMMKMGIETPAKPSDPSAAVSEQPQPQPVTVLSGTEDPQERIASALGSLLGEGADDPAKQAELAANLELLATVKKNDPDMFNSGLEFLKSAV